VRTRQPDSFCAPKREPQRPTNALDNLPNKVLAAEYQTVLPDEKLIAEELDRSHRELEKRAGFAHVPSKR